MDWTLTLRAGAADAQLEAWATLVGEDVLICLAGGTHPHLGCVVQAVPRPSLRDGARLSATASVLNLPGHKDEALCRLVAERVCAALGRVTVCTGGFHLDGMTPARIDEVVRCAAALADGIARGLSPAQAGPSAPFAVVPGE